CCRSAVSRRCIGSAVFTPNAHCARAELAASRMRFIVAVVGRPKHASLAAAIRDYEARARRYWPLDIHEVKDEPVKAANTELVRAREGERLAAAAGGAQLVACEVGGR